MKTNYHNHPILFLSIARELQSLAGNDKSGQLARFRQLYGEFRVFLHRNHYLLMLLKRHIIVLSSHDIAKYDQEQVTEIKKMCEEVSSERLRGPSNFLDFGLLGISDTEEDSRNLFNWLTQETPVTSPSMSRCSTCSTSSTLGTRATAASSCAT